jgi:hypothetical protein
MTADRVLPTTRRRALLALAPLTALSLTACSGGGDAEFEEDGGAGNGAADADGGSGSDAGGQEPSAASDGGGEEQAADGDVTASSVDPAEAIATLDYALPTDEIEGTMTVGLHHLRRRGETLELLLTFTPEFSGSEAYTLWQLHGENHAMVGPALFDRENLTRYDILTTNGGWSAAERWSSEQAEHELASGASQSYWATFAAPVDDVDVLDVGLPVGATFEEVPIEQGEDASADGAEG